MCSSLFAYIYTCLPKCTKVCLLNIAWRLKLIPDPTCFYVAVVLNVVKNFARRKFSTDCFPQHSFFPKLFITLVISKFLISIIKYIGKVQCLWTSMDHKYRSNHNVYDWFSPSFITTGNYFTSMLQRYQRNKRNVTASQAFVQYSLVKLDTRAGWKNCHYCDMFEDFETSQSAMGKDKTVCSFMKWDYVKYWNPNHFFTLCFFSLEYFGLEKLSHHNLNLLAKLDEVSRTYTGEVLIKCKHSFVYRNP